MKAYDNYVQQIAILGRELPLGFSNQHGVFHCSLLVRLAETGIIGYLRQKI